MGHNLLYTWRINIILILLGLLGLMIPGTISTHQPPHVLFIMVDDMGWNDVSFHGSDQIMTPNLDALAYQGVILQNYYSDCICTPARTALLTGKYPMRLGMHSFPLYNSEDRGIPLTERLLPSYMKELGYATHLVGKWHVGMSKNEYLPTRRGYDSHYGMRGGFTDYYNYGKVEMWPDGRLFFGMDLFDDMEPQTDEQRYLVDALTDRAINIINAHNDSQPLFLHLTHIAPHAGNNGAALQPPPHISSRNKHVANPDRRLYADLMTYFDRSIGRIVRALYDKRILQDTMIIFVSDNGAPTVGQYSNWGVNLPFRGLKSTPWEGGVRVPAFIWHSTLRPRVWDGLMHITDWLPTLTAAAGGELTKPIDGVNQWDAIVQDGESKRKEVLITVDDIENFAAYRFGDYKIIVGNMTNMRNGYYGEEYMPVKEKPPKYFPELLSSDVARIMDSIGLGLDVQEVAAMRNAATVRQLDTIRDSSLCEPTLTRGCLFNIRRDPMERHDLWDESKKMSGLLASRVRALWSEQVHRGPLAVQAEADPAKLGYVWTPWLSDSAISVNGNIENIEIPHVTQVNEKKYVTKAIAVNCTGQTRLQNFLCLLRSVF